MIIGLIISVIRLATDPLNRCQEVCDWFQKLFLNAVYKSILNDGILNFPHLLITTNNIATSKEMIALQPRFNQLWEEVSWR